MATFDDLLIEHQKLFSKLMSDPNNLDLLKQVKTYYEKLILVVNIYCEVADHSFQDSKLWNRKAERLCELKTLIEKQGMNL